MWKTKRIKEVLNILNLIDVECPNQKGFDDRDSHCAFWDNCLDCWKYSLEKELEKRELEKNKGGNDGQSD